jgi:calcineurin-like phosphoesterase family protein
MNLNLLGLTNKCRFENMGNVFFSSDLHLFHKRDFVWKERGYDSVEAHSKAVISKINENVQKDDFLFYLGDFSLNSTPEQTLEALNSINCSNICYIWGNHESNVRRIYRDGLKQDHEFYPIKLGNVTFAGWLVEATINGQYTVCCHFPMEGWNHQRDGAWHIHGHEHRKLTTSLPDYPKGKRLDVGWDVFPYPVSFQEVKGIMDKKEVTTIGHHGE